MSDCCKNCFYVRSWEDKNYFFQRRWGCDYHKLYDGEVSHPDSQSCDKHITPWIMAIQRRREDRLKELGI